MHDQAFLKLAMKEMLNEAEIDPDKYIVIGNDNCFSQYMSAPHFHNLQETCNKYKSKTKHLYSVVVIEMVKLTM